MSRCRRRSSFADNGPPTRSRAAIVLHEKLPDLVERPLPVRDGVFHRLVHLSVRLQRAGVVQRLTYRFALEGPRVSTTLGSCLGTIPNLGFPTVFLPKQTQPRGASHLTEALRLKDGIPSKSRGPAGRDDAPLCDTHKDLGLHAWACAGWGQAERYWVCYLGARTMAIQHASLPQSSHSASKEKDRAAHHH